MSRTSRRRQQGLTMVELIIGMAVTSILMVGMTGVLFTASSASNNWIDRIETSGTGDVLAAALIADTHHYVACGTSSDELKFCYANSVPPDPAVTYESAEQVPYSVTRVVRNGGRQLLVRDLSAPLRYHVTCTSPANVDAGFVSVLGMPGRGEIRVYFVTAHGGCQTS